MRSASASGRWVISGGSSTIRRPPRCSRVNRGRARSLVRLRARLSRSADLGPQRLLGRRLVQPLDVEAVVGAHEQRLVRQERDLLPVGRHARHHRRPARRLGGTVLPTGHPDAGNQPPQVPLPGTGMRLVEVVQIDDQLALR